MSCKLIRPEEGLHEAAHLLEACHERFCGCLETLRKLTLWVGEHGADEAARQAAASVLRQFRREAERHYDEEERLVFPRLMARAGDAERRAVAELVEILEADHQRLRAGWDVVVGRLEAIAAGDAASLAAGEVRDFALTLCSHIECEQTKLIPLMQRLLHPSDHVEIGRAMRSPRHVAALVPDAALA